MRNRIMVNGIELAFDEHPGTTRPFVLVHGFTGAADDFGEHLEPLAALGRTIALDQRGHGDSSNTGDAMTYTLDQLVDDLRGFPEAQATLAGWIADGSLKIAIEEVEGLESLPEAFCGLFRGENFGRRLARLGPDPQ